MEVAYTDHAEEKLRSREISKTLVEQAVTNPDAVKQGKFGRTIAHKHIKDYLLRYIRQNRIGCW